MPEPDSIIEISLSRPDSNRAANSPDTKLALLVKTLELVLGDRKSAIEFCRRLAGCVLIIPPASQLERQLSEDVVWKALNRDCSLASRRRVSEMVGRNLQFVSRTYLKWQRLCRERVEREDKEVKAERTDLHA
jgi:hypothetical protein